MCHTVVTSSGGLICTRGVLRVRLRARARHTRGGQTCRLATCAAKMELEKRIVVESSVRIDFGCASRRAFGTGEGSETSRCPRG